MFTSYSDAAPQKFDGVITFDDIVNYGAHAHVRMTIVNIKNFNILVIIDDCGCCVLLLQNGFFSIFFKR